MAPLPDDRVGIWYVRTKEVTDAPTLAAVRALLTEEEKKKHLAYRFEKHRHEYLVTRAIERGVLATCLGQRPAALAFVRNEYGRPELRPPSKLHFNLTNSVDLVACAVVVEREIGVDTEPLERGDDILDIAASVFTTGERAMLEGFDLDRRRRRAVELWTLKEAYMKARGMGMSIPPSTFEVLFDGDVPRTLRFDASIADDPSRWHLATRDVTDHLVSVCVERHASSEPAPAIVVERAGLAEMLVGPRA